MENKKTVKIRIDNQTIRVAEGEVLSAVLWRQGIKVLSHSYKNKQPRGLYCGIGRCENCVVKNNGVKVKACLTLVESDMDIITQE